MNNIWKISYISQTRNIYLNWKILLLLTNSLSLNDTILNKLFLLKSIVHSTKVFSFNYKNIFKVIHVNKIFKLNSTNFIINKSNLSQLIKQTTSVPNHKLNVHPSFHNYYQYTSKNKYLLNIKKLTHLWNNIITFLINLFYYDLKHMTFSNSYFKYEVLALNWKISNFINSMWRFSNSFIFFISNKTTSMTEFYFRYLLSRGFKCAFIIDLYYHKSTIYFLNKFKFITIGPVPLVNNLYTFYLSVPIPSNSVISNLLFIRLILKLKKLNSKNKIVTNLNRKYN